MPMKKKNQLISKFVRYGNIPAIRGKYMMYNLLGRGIARENDTNRSGLGSEINKLKALDPTYAETYEACIKRLNGTESASYGVVPFHRHFWRSDYTIHQRPEYTMDVRMASTRTARCENGNGENLKGYFITEGGTGIVRRGDEYANIFPSWDWSHIPGTTTPSVKVIPQPGQWEHKGQSTFTGGVSDEVYGVTTYQLTDQDFNINTTAKKSWFFFDKEIVCMGSDIQSKNIHPIHTTVNQCFLKGKVNVITKNLSNEGEQVKSNQTYRDLICVNHDSISYYFPEGGNITISRQVQTGSWKELSQHLSDAPVSQPVFKLWMNHGVRPSKGKYIYYVMPNTGSAKEAVKNMDQLLTINTDKVQAVLNQDLNILGAVFHQPGSLKLGEVEIASSTPCVAMFTQLHTDTVKVYVADPSYTLSGTTLSIQTPHLGDKKNIDCQWKTDVHFAGSTHCLTVSKE